MYNKGTEARCDQTFAYICCEEIGPDQSRNVNRWEFELLRCLKGEVMLKMCMVKTPGNAGEHREYLNLLGVPVYPS